MVVTYICGDRFFIPRLIFRMVRWLRQFLPRQKGPCAALNLADGRSNSCRARNWSRNTDACLCYGGRSDGFVGFRMTVIAGVFSVLSFLCYLLCVRLTAERNRVPASEGKIQFTSQLKNLMKNRALLGIIAAAMFLLLALLGMQGISAYVFRKCIIAPSYGRDRKSDTECDTKGKGERRK